MTKEYHKHELIDAIDEMCGNNYAAKSGCTFCCTGECTDYRRGLGA